MISFDAFMQMLHDARLGESYATNTSHMPIRCALAVWDGRASLVQALDPVHPAAALILLPAE